MFIIKIFLGWTNNLHYRVEAQVSLSSITIFLYSSDNQHYKSVLFPSILLAKSSFTLCLCASSKESKATMQSLIFHSKAAIVEWLGKSQCLLSTWPQGFALQARSLVLAGWCLVHLCWDRHLPGSTFPGSWWCWSYNVQCPLCCSPEASRQTQSQGLLTSANSPWQSEDNAPLSTLTPRGRNRFEKTRRLWGILASRQVQISLNWYFFKLNQLKLHLFVSRCLQTLEFDWNCETIHTKKHNYNRQIDLMHPCWFKILTQKTTLNFWMAVYHSFHNNIK